ncbi:MAG: signal recognition particle protein, partial [Coriobacteriia bacterium]|nr:signal recognition particle protein [Coriobacteriia bacterium]
LAKRILGMGDVVSLIERAQEAADESLAADTEERLRKGEFTLDDFRSQLKQIKKMGGLGSLVQMMPGMKGAAPDVDESQLDRVDAIISSMTIAERAKPQIISGPRRARIASGAGVTVFDVNQLLKQFAQAKKLMKQMQKPGNKKRGRFQLPPGMQNPF